MTTVEVSSIEFQIDHRFMIPYLISGMIDCCLEIGYYRTQKQIYIKYKYFIKTCLMPFLFLFYFMNAYTIEVIDHRFSLALLFGWLGDICLMFPKMEQLGAGFFALGHLCYILAFSYMGLPYWNNTSMEYYQYLPFLFPTILYAFAMIYIAPKVKDVRTSMSAYFFLLTVMSQSTGFLFYTPYPTGGMVSFIGSLFFFVSDCIISLHFLTPKKIPHAPVILMILYIGGQLLITYGVLMIYTKIKLSSV